jgi:hypothetical protein
VGFDFMQEEYAREGIDWSYVEFIDNQDCLDLLEGNQAQPNLAVFPLIDEACRMPRATYQVTYPYCNGRASYQLPLADDDGVLLLILATGPWRCVDTGIQ